MGALKLAVIILIAATLAACASTRPLPVSRCAGWEPIYPEKADVPVISDTLAGQVLSHNLHGRDVCGWLPPTKKAAQ